MSDFGESSGRVMKNQGVASGMRLALEKGGPGVKNQEDDW